MAEEGTMGPMPLFTVHQVVRETPRGQEAGFELQLHSACNVPLIMAQFVSNYLGEVALAEAEKKQKLEIPTTNQMPPFGPPGRD